MTPGHVSRQPKARQCHSVLPLSFDQQVSRRIVGCGLIVRVAQLLAPGTAALRNVVAGTVDGLRR